MTKQQWTLLGGVGLGAGLMFLLDPDKGRRRRALVRDKAARSANLTGSALRKTGKDVGNRTRGLTAKASGLRHRDETPDGVLAARVRSKLGRAVSHPGAIEVDAFGGCVTLSGPVLASELDDLLSCVRKVRGVGAVENRLEVHEEPGDVSALQGGPARASTRSGLFRQNWGPATRLLAGTTGGALAVAASRRRDPLGAALGAVGLGLLARGLTNLDTKRLLGVGAGRRAIDFQKTLHVAAPPAEVYRFWSDFENFPQFMSHVRAVQNLGDGRSRWVVDGPGGVPVKWEAEVVEQVPNELIAWRSVQGSVVGNAGIVHFEPEGQGTRVHLRLTYNPPAGAIGHAFAALFGRDPKKLMDEDLVRFKSLIEDGKTTAAGETVHREEVLEPLHV